MKTKKIKIKKLVVPLMTVQGNEVVLVDILDYMPTLRQLNKLKEEYKVKVLFPNEDEIVEKIIDIEVSIDDLLVMAISKKEHIKGE